MTWGISPAERLRIQRTGAASFKPGGVPVCAYTDTIPLPVRRMHHRNYHGMPRHIRPQIAWDRESELLRDVTKSFEAADFGLVFNAFQKGHEMPTAGVAFTGTHGAARQSACTHHQQAHHHYLTG